MFYSVLLNSYCSNMLYPQFQQTPTNQITRLVCYTSAPFALLWKLQSIHTVLECSPFIHTVMESSPNSHYCGIFYPIHTVLKCSPPIHNALECLSHDFYLYELNFELVHFQCELAQHCLTHTLPLYLRAYEHPLLLQHLSQIFTDRFQ